MIYDRCVHIETRSFRRHLAVCLLSALLLPFSGCAGEAPDEPSGTLALSGKLRVGEDSWIPASPDSEMRLLCGEVGEIDISARADIASDGSFLFESVPRSLERCQLAACRAPRQLTALPVTPRPRTQQRITVRYDEPRQQHPHFSEDVPDQRMWLRMRGINGFAPFEFMTTLSLAPDGRGWLQFSLIHPGHQKIHTSERDLTPAEVAEVRELVPRARLFDGAFLGHDGRGSDGYLQVLDAVVGGHATSVVVSGNRSFEDGPRGQIADYFDRLRRQASEPEP